MDESRGGSLHRPYYRAHRRGTSRAPACNPGGRFLSLALLVFTLSSQWTNPHWGDDLYWLLVFALLAVHGPGSMSLDALLDRILTRIFPQLGGKPAFSLDGVPRVVI